MSGSLDVAGELDYSQRPVPPSGRMPKLNLTMAFWAICSAMFFLIISATLAEIYGTANTIIGLILTVISYSAINAVITRYAIRSGLSVSLFSRLLFGRYGSAIATFIYAVSSIYYAVFEGSVIATAATYYFEGLTFAVAALIVCIYSVPLILGSVQHWLDKFNGYLLPLYLLGLLGTVVYAISHYGYSNDWLTMTPEGGAPPYGWINVFIAFMGVWWMMMCTFDFARFGKKEDENYHAVFNFGLPFYTLTYFVNGLVGIFLVQTIPLEGATSEVSVVKALIVMMGALGLLFVWISQTRINTTNFYLSTVNMQAFFRLVFKLEMPKYVWAIIVGIIVYFVMLANIFQYILIALAYQGIFVVAWVGVALAYILCGQHDGAGEEGERSDDEFPAYYAPGMVAWFSAVALGIGLLLVPGWELLSAPATVISSFVLFWVLSSRTMLAKPAYQR
jgi:cytosine permease